MAIPSSIYYLPRRLHVFWTALLVYLVLKTTQLLNRVLRRDSEAAELAWANANTRAAHLILRTANQRRGLWIKCCQYVAARSDALPEEYSTVLSKSLDDCPPTPAPLVSALVDAELAKTDAGISFADERARPPTVDDLFEGFDPQKPIASASIAQVHVATERATGVKVVLKIQHPGVRRMLLQDLNDLATLLQLIAGAEPKYDMRPVMNAWIEMVPLETDFLHERHNLESVRKIICREDTHDEHRNSEGDSLPKELQCAAHVPRPFSRLSTEKVFVMEYSDGIRISDVHDLPDKDAVNGGNYVERTRLIDEITRSFGLQLFVADVFSGDPHPGNFLVRNLESGGIPVLLDFGICVAVTHTLRLGFARLILAALHNDSYMLTTALEQIGVKLNRTDPTTSLDIIKYLFRTTAPRDESREEHSAFYKDMAVRNEANEKELKKAEQEKRTPPDGRSRTPADSFPGHLVFFFRSLGMLRGLATTLGVRHSYLEALKPYAEHALLSEIPPKDHISSIVHQPVYAVGEDALHAADMLGKVLSHMYTNDMLLGMQVCVYIDGEKRLDFAMGTMGRNDPRPVTPDTLFNSFSTTKGLAALVFATVQEAYNVQYDDRVIKYWPEYGQNGKDTTTISHVLSHTAGLARTLPPNLTMDQLRDDLEGVIKHFEEAKPAHPPGAKMEYHAMSFGWLIAALVQKISGEPFTFHLGTLTKDLGIDEECFCGNLPENLLSNKAGSRVASLASYFVQDMQRQTALSGHAAKVQTKDKATKSGESEGDSSDTVTKGKGVQETFEGSNTNRNESKSADHSQDVITSILDQMDETSGADDGDSIKDKIPPFLLDLNFYNHPTMRAACIPSANGHFSARALAKLYSVLASPRPGSLLTEERIAAMQSPICEFEHRGRRAWGAGLTLYDVIDPNTGTHNKYGAIGHGGIGGSMAFAVPGHKFAIAVTLNKLNALSISAGLAIALTCRAFKVPMPESYETFARLVLLWKEKSWGLRENWNVGKFNNEEDIMKELTEQVTSEDPMKILVG